MDNPKKKKDALLYHAEPKPGKIEVMPTKKYASQRDLSLAYSPGVAEPCLEIAKEIGNVYKYTAKGNLVAVISNGTAVLGLGNIGPQASKPVMEGKGLLFKIFADIDVFDIEVDAKDVDKFVETVKAIAPTFGGINLEDIKAPEAFEIERRLKDELDIPVMHDDQHGTAIISAAALKNAIELTDKKIDSIKMVVNGAGAAAISCSKLYIKMGVKPENIIMCDSKGVIRKDRSNLTFQKKEFATELNLNTLDEAMVDSDVFIGLSKGNVVSPKMILSMNKNPIVFAMANPDPEIDYDLAIKTRSDIIMATGRSDKPNQVNNVLGFPFIFRGALDVRATKINEDMKMAASLAIADLAKQIVPEQVKLAYNKTNIHFGRDYIIPKPFDSRLITEIPPAVAKAAINSKVAKKTIVNWEKYREELAARLGAEHKLMRILTNRAKTDPKRVLFAEADQLNVLKAAQIAHEEGIVTPILLGRKDLIYNLMNRISFDLDIEIIDPKSDEEKLRREYFAQKYWERVKRKGMTLYEAQKLMRERNNFAAMMINEGQADALVTGYTRSYPAVAKPMLELIGKEKNVERIAATTLLLNTSGPLFLSDTAININPSSYDLVNIAIMTAQTIRMFGLEPCLALLSYSNFGSSRKEYASKIADAVRILHNSYPELNVDGEMQADFALNQNMMKDKFPFSKILNKKVNGLIFPNLDAANISYKILKEVNKSEIIGPIIMGLNKPVHILQLGASVDEIVNMVSIAVVDAQQKNTIISK